MFYGVNPFRKKNINESMFTATVFTTQQAFALSHRGYCECGNSLT